MGYSYLLQRVCSFGFFFTHVNRGNGNEAADEWRVLAPTEAATGAGDIYALLEYEYQMQIGNLLALSRGTF